ncbi:MAG: 4-hydroxythreonine-4-phosphate dehydrogenase PdxA [Gammaproteobacteria bacterium]
MSKAPGRPRVVISTGEPAGIGPELTLKLAQQDLSVFLACTADPALLTSLNEDLGLGVELETVSSCNQLKPHRAGQLQIIECSLAEPVTAGKLNPRNAKYVLDCLDIAINACRGGSADAMVTAPIQKSVINEAGISFTGHTEYLAAQTHTPTAPIMLLASTDLRIALVTTHLRISRVASQITRPAVLHAIKIVDAALKKQFGVPEPRIAVCGLNPHAGENGHFGNEEHDFIEPAINAAREAGVDVYGPLPADTAFTPPNRSRFDAYVSMFHDQGLPVIKALDFGEIVNVTLGLPIIRTSVDHGTGLDIAGQGIADVCSLLAATELASGLASGQHS